MANKLERLFASKLLMTSPGKSYNRGRLSTVDLLVPTSSDHLLFILKIFFYIFTKQATLMRWSAVLSLPPQLVFPGYSNTGYGWPLPLSNIRLVRDEANAS
jgi:hypothetical protein